MHLTRLRNQCLYLGQHWVYLGFKSHWIFPPSKSHHAMKTYPAATRHQTIVDLMLAQRRRLWANITPTWGVSRMQIRFHISAF